MNYSVGLPYLITSKHQVSLPRSMDSLPQIAPFPDFGIWSPHILASEWAAYLDSSLALVRAHLSLSDISFTALSLKDDSVAAFLTALFRHIVTETDCAPSDEKSGTVPETLKRACFLLAARTLRSQKPPASLLHWRFLSDFCFIYRKERSGKILEGLSVQSIGIVDTSLSGLKKDLVRNMKSGTRGYLKTVEESLRRVNFLISSRPSTGVLLLAGGDLLDALVDCFKIMNPPLRQCVITTTYLCFIGQTEGANPRYSFLSDILYSLCIAAEEHKAGPLSKNDSLVAELVTVTPLLQQIQLRAQISGASTSRLLSIVKDLSQYRNTQGISGLSLPHGRRTKRKPEKDKGANTFQQFGGHLQVLHAHKLSQVSQIKSIFPYLGSAFIAKLLDKYGDDAEQVVTHILEDNVPSWLMVADRTESLILNSAATSNNQRAVQSRPSDPVLSTRRNVFDGDEMDTLAAETTTKLQFGKQSSNKSVDDMLRDHPSSSQRAAILSALAAFDSDDDERDDTYDTADIGGTVDSSATSGHSEKVDLGEANERALFTAYRAAPAVFDRDAATRHSATRFRLKETTNMTDEAIEGWGLMLARNPQQQRRLEAKLSTYGGHQTELAPTSWRANVGNSGDGSDPEAGTSGAGVSIGAKGRRGAPGGGGPGRHGARDGSSVSRPALERESGQTRRHKEAHKGSKANHNRRDQRAKKMTRSTF